MENNPEEASKAATTKAKGNNRNQRKADTPTTNSLTPRKMTAVRKTAMSTSSGASTYEIVPRLLAAAPAAAAAQPTATGQKRSKNGQAAGLGSGPNPGAPGYDPTQHETASQGLDRIIKEAIAAPRRPLPHLRAPLPNGRHPLPTGKPSPAMAKKDKKGSTDDEEDEDEDEDDE
jgi:hypothetical protein